MGDRAIPTLMTIMYGEGAEEALDQAPQRLLRWCRAFEDWLEERGKGHPKNRQKLQFAWRQLLSQTGKGPWEITPEDISTYTQWLKAQGRAARTISNYLVALSSFYRWCKQHHGEANEDMRYNPVREAPRPKVRRFERAKVLSREEACALLAVLKLDDCILTKRDYAFFLARLRMGVPLRELQQLRLGEVENGQNGILVNWGGGEAETRRGDGETRRGGGSQTAPLPEDVKRAIVDYLRAAGRLEGMRAEAYVFAPLADPLRREAPDKAEDWDDYRYLVTRQFNAVLKTYGRLAGIPDEKLTLQALRHTAAMLRMEAGDSAEAIQAFLTHSALSYTKHYLKLLPLPPREEGHLRDLANDPPQLPERKAPQFQPGDNLTHGLYAQKQPAEEIAAVLAEDIQGMGEEIAALRALCRGIMEMQNQAENAAQVARLADAYTLAATRLAEMIKAERQSQESRPEDSWGEAFLAMLVESAQRDGADIDIDTARERALASDPEYGAAAWRLVEEIAATRLALRRVFHLAMETQELGERVHLTEVHGRGCGRLARLLKAQGLKHTRLDAVMNKLFDDVHAEVTKELGID